MLGRSIVSAGFACMSVASGQLLLWIVKDDESKNQRVLSLVSTIATIQSVWINSICGYLCDNYGRKPLLVAGVPPRLSLFATSVAPKPAGANFHSVHNPSSPVIERPRPQINPSAHHTASGVGSALWVPHQSPDDISHVIYEALWASHIATHKTTLLL